jgi:hypothetical protein
MTSKHLLFAFIGLTMFALAGCSTAPRIPERVLLPIATECPVPDLPARPTVPAAIRQVGVSDAETARAIAIYISQLNGHIDALTALLTGYSKPATAPIE